MNSYETSATVQERGKVHLSDVPFAPGTEVEVMVREKAESDTAGSAAPLNGAEDLFAEMRPFMVDAEQVGEAREAIYTAMEGE